MGATLVLDIETVSPVGHDNCDPALLSAVRDMAGDRMDPDTFGALCPPLARVVCVCLARLDVNDEIASELALVLEYACKDDKPPVGAEAHDGEAALLSRLAEILAKADRLVTFNGSGFDVPVLLLRSMAHGIPQPVLLRAHQEYRYKPDLNYDLREQFTSFGRFRDGSLRAFALGMGMADPKGEGDGAHVADLVASGDAAALVRYCQGDVRTAAGLYRRWREFTGQRMRLVA